MKIKLIPQPKGPMKVDNLAEAQKEGYFTYGMPTSKLISAVLKRNPTLGVSTGNFGRTFWDAYEKKAVVGIGWEPYLPQFQLQDRNNDRILCRSWKGIVKILRREGYTIHEKDLR